MDKEYVKYMQSQQRDEDKDKQWNTIAEKYSPEFAQVFTRDTDIVSRLFKEVGHTDITAPELAEYYTKFIREKR